MQGRVGGDALILGNTALMAQADVTVDSLKDQAETLRASGASVMYLAVNQRLAGLLAVSDPIKESTPEAVAQLQRTGIRVIMATGDGVATARAVASTLGIDEYYGEVKPADKLSLVTRLQQKAVSSPWRGRYQRRACSGEGRRRYCDGNGNRCCDE